MKNAVQAVSNGIVSLSEAAKQYNIVKTTLFHYVRKMKTDPRTRRLVPNFACRQISTMSEEKLLAEYILMSSKMQHGLSKKQVRLLAFEFAEENNMSTPQNWCLKQTAGDDWLYDLLKRQGNLALRTPRATSF